MYSTLEIIAFSVALIIILVSGFILHRQPSPYPWFLFNVHKLFTIGLIVYFAIKHLHSLKQLHSLGTLQISILASATFFLILLVTGAFLSKGKKQNPLLIVHKIASIALLLSITLMTYFSFDQINILN